MRDTLLYNNDEIVYRECLKFCFMHVVQTELNRVAVNWNVHRIRKSNNVESLPGPPDVLYFHLDSVRAQDYLVSVDVDEIDIAEETFCARPPVRGCSEQFNELAKMIMPNNASEARTLC